MIFLLFTPTHWKGQKCPLSRADATAINHKNQTIAPCPDCRPLSPLIKFWFTAPSLGPSLGFSFSLSNILGQTIQSQHCASLPVFTNTSNLANDKPLSITKNDNIEFELFSIACSIGQYSSVDCIRIRTRGRIYGIICP